MNRCATLFPTVFLLVWAFSVPLAAASPNSAEPMKEGVLSGHSDEDKAVISETGQAKDYFRPDLAIITLGVETEDKTAGGAIAENARKADGIITVLKGLIDPAKGDSIKTSSFSLQPVYEYSGTSRRFRGYMVRNLVTVRTKAIKSVGHIIDEAVQSGANTVQGLRFTLSDEKEFCDSVLKKAAEQAKREAVYVAGLLGAEISGVKNISSSCGTEAPRPIYGVALAAKAAKEVPETAIESGDIAVSATVNVVFRLRQDVLP